jgi:hypothetical protein
MVDPPGESLLAMATGRGTSTHSGPSRHHTVDDAIATSFRLGDPIIALEAAVHRYLGDTSLAVSLPIR